MKDRNDKFKTEEKLQTVIEKKQSVPPLDRDVRVFVEKVRPVYEGPSGSAGVRLESRASYHGERASWH